MARFFLTADPEEREYYGDMLNTKYVLVANDTINKIHSLELWAGEGYVFQTESLIYRLYISQPYQGYELVYENPELKIYERLK